MYFCLGLRVEVDCIARGEGHKGFPLFFSFVIGIGFLKFVVIRNSGMCMRGAGIVEMF